MLNNKKKQKSKNNKDLKMATKEKENDYVESTFNNKRNSQKIIEYKRRGLTSY